MRELVAEDKIELRVEELDYFMVFLVYGWLGGFLALL